LAQEGRRSAVHGNTSLASGLAIGFAISYAVAEPVTEPIGEPICVSIWRTIGNCSCNGDRYADATPVPNTCELQRKCRCAGVYARA
jgi:hypothetical protein